MRTWFDPLSPHVGSPSRWLCDVVQPNLSPKCAAFFGNVSEARNSTTLLVRKASDPKPITCSIAQKAAAATVHESGRYADATMGYVSPSSHGWSEVNHSAGCDVAILHGKKKKIKVIQKKEKKKKYIQELNYF